MLMAGGLPILPCLLPCAVVLVFANFLPALVAKSAIASTPRPLLLNGFVTDMVMCGLFTRPADLILCGPGLWAPKYLNFYENMFYGFGTCANIWPISHTNGLSLKLKTTWRHFLMSFDDDQIDVNLAFLNQIRTGRADDGSPSRPNTPPPDFYEVEEEKDDLDEPGRSPSGKKFDFHARRVFLTYTNLPNDVSLQAFQAALLLKNNGPGTSDIGHITKFCIGREVHFSGAVHFHCYCSFLGRPHYKDVRCFDLRIAGDERHPNIRLLSKEKDVQAAIHYCRKDGEFVLDGVRLYPTPINFIKRKADDDAWCAYNKRLHGHDVHSRSPVSWPIRLPNGVQVPSPTADQRERVHLLVGPPGCGKSKWLNETLGTSDVFLATHPQYPFEGYAQEQVIVFDDYDPSKLVRDMLIRLVNVTSFPHVHGGWCRGTGNNAFLKPNQVRLVIILCNPDKLPVFYTEHDAAMISRCIKHDL